MRYNLRRVGLVLVILVAVESKAIADSVSLGLLGLTSHGDNVLIDSRAYRLMDRKLTKVGYTVWHPELSLTIEKSGFLVNTTYLKDCFSRSSYYVGVGYRWPISENFSASLLGGIYFRENPIISRDFSRIERYEKQVIFAPWISLERDFKLSKGFLAFVSVSSNYALTHSTLGFKRIFE